MPRVSPRKAFAAILGRQRRDALAEGGSAPDADQSTFVYSAFANAGDGVATTTLTFTAKDVDGNATPNVPLEWSQDRITLSAADSIVTAAPTTIEDDGVDPSVITVQVRTQIDAAYIGVRGIPGANVVLSSTGSNNTIDQPTVTTSGTGQTSGSIVSTTAEAKTVSATVVGQLVTDTAAVTVSGDPAALHPNEPGGAVMFANFEGDVEESGGDAMGITWMGAWTVDAGAPAGNLAVVVDTDNPVGSGEALRFIFDQAYNPRCADATGTFPAQKSELYISLRIKFNDSFAPKMYYIGLPNVAGSDDFYIDRGTTGKIRCVLQAGGSVELIDSSEAAPKGNSSTPMTVGVWHQIELVGVAETSPGAGDGSVTMWVDDVQVGQDTSVTWGGNFGSLEWYGDINTVVGNPSYQVGELYLSGTDA